MQAISFDWYLHHFQLQLQDGFQNVLFQYQDIIAGIAILPAVSPIVFLLFLIVPLKKSDNCCTIFLASSGLLPINALMEFRLLNKKCGCICWRSLNSSASFASFSASCFLLSFSFCSSQLYHIHKCNVTQPSQKNHYTATDDQGAVKKF